MTTEERDFIVRIESEIASLQRQFSVDLEYLRSQIRPAGRLVDESKVSTYVKERVQSIKSKPVNEIV